MKYLVIPAYEPDEKLIQLLSELHHHNEIRIIVVNDGSSEKYNEIFRKAAQYATILKHTQNQGKGRALKTAFLYIDELTGQNHDSRGIIATADSDGQHTPEDILQVFNACEATSKAFVTGVRCFKGNIPWKSRCGNTITKHVFSFAADMKLQDTQCGLRAFPCSMLPFLCTVTGERYEYEMNVLLKATGRFAIKEVQVATVYIDGNSASHFNPVLDALRIYKEILKFTMSSFIGFLTDYMIYAVLVSIMPFTHVGVCLATANVTARIFSAAVNYYLNRKFVFNDDQKILKTGVKYAFLAAAVLTLNTGILIGLNKLGLHNPYLIKIITELLLFSLSWVVQKKFIFKRRTVKLGGETL